MSDLREKRYYVVFRGARYFTASFVKPDSDEYIVESHCGFIEVRNEDVAYYYVALLNYLAYKVAESKRSVQRAQLARPLTALYVLGLSWCDVDEKIRLRVAELSKKLHEKAPSKEYGNQSVALREISTYPEFRELRELLDKVVDKRKLEEALDLVSG